MDILAILNRIEGLLKESGRSKAELYATCSVSASAVSQWKSGRTSPSTKSLQRIADYLNVSYEYLISGAGQKEKMPILEDKHESDGLSDIYFSLAKDMQDSRIDPEDIRNFMRIIAKNMQKE